MRRGNTKRRPATGIPTRVLVLAMAGGRVTSITGVGCGRPDPSVVDAARAGDVAQAGDVAA
ncbi:hypothetical protein [Streptomyces sp. XY593]|uniref:hypothetical protein n=1 Tax=Streptomyces sp. XY593 TaxID=1519483 RepID=UPI000A40BD2C|nr:hypothetical protein [Streptomyces sp. XY593]